MNLGFLVVAASFALSIVGAHAAELVSSPSPIPKFAPDKPDDGVPKKYRPAIRGRLTKGSQPLVTENVCVREDGSQIRACGWSDFAGNFYIPASGKLHPTRMKAGKDGTSAFPIYWLETGRVNAARRLGTVALVDDKTASIDLDCDVARSAVLTATDADACRPKSLVAIAPHDAAPHRAHAARKK